MATSYRHNSRSWVVATAHCGLLSWAVFITGCGIQSGQPQAATQSHQVAALQILPAGAEVPAGASLQMTAIGVFSDGRKQDLTGSVRWNSTTVSIAQVNGAGSVLGLAAGAVKISASDGNVVGTQVVRVTPAALTSISITPPAAAVPLGENTQFMATGQFTDGSTKDLTTAATWSLAQPTVASLDRPGAVHALALGKSQVTASIAGLNGSASVTISQAALTSINLASPTNASVPIGSAVQLTATGRFSDGSVQDLTSQVSWSSTPVGIFGIAQNGLATSQSVGTARITALSGPVASSVSLSATPAALVSLTLNSEAPALPVGATEQLAARGTYTDKSQADMTARVAWQTSSPSIISVDATGIASAKAVGSAVVTAATEGLSASSTLSATQAVLASVSVIPQQMQTPLGTTVGFQLMGTYTDGSTSVITDSIAWSSSTGSVAVIDNSGSASAVGVGITTISAAYQGFTDATTLTVQPVLAINYFTNTPTVDSTIRLTNVGLTGSNLCAMIYVFDESQEMAECCGCFLSPDGLRTLSLRKDLTSNPLTGRVPARGSIEVVASDYASNRSCDASTPTPAGLIASWGLHLTKVSAQSYLTTETAFQTSPLGANDLQSLASQCWFIHSDGSNQGLCTCGTGD